jgi:hypothetical protein
VILTYNDEKLGPTRAIHVVACKHFTRYTLVVLCAEKQVEAYTQAMDILTGTLRVW